ncbi:hypothetical protein [Halorientalis sp.]|uniref:hypothetical protein n=1 Tax=Halorientalis sp. TaxID=1931229 RepID=UPI0039C85DEC
MYDDTTAVSGGSTTQFGQRDARTRDVGFEGQTVVMDDPAHGLGLLPAGAQRVDRTSSSGGVGTCVTCPNVTT